MWGRGREGREKDDPVQDGAQTSSCLTHYFTEGKGKPLPPAITLQSVQLTKINIVPAGIEKNTQVLHLNFCTANNKG